MHCFSHLALAALDLSSKLKLKSIIDMPQASLGPVFDGLGDILALDADIVEGHAQVKHLVVRHLLDLRHLDIEVLAELHVFPHRLTITLYNGNYSTLSSCEYFSPVVHLYIFLEKA